MDGKGLQSDRRIGAQLPGANGFKKGDPSKFIEDAVRQRVFEQTVQEARARNAHVPPEQIEDAIEEALTEVRAARCHTAHESWRSLNLTPEE